MSFDKELYWKKRKLGLRGQNEILGTKRASKEIAKIVANPLKYASLINRKSLGEQINEAIERPESEAAPTGRRRKDAGK